MCGTWLTWLINQHSNFPQYDLALKSYNSSLEDGKIVRKTLDVGCFGADWFTYKYIPKESSYYDENTVKIIKKIKYLLKEKGMTIKGVKAVLNNTVSLELDETLNNNINTGTINKANLINKVKKITSIIKDLKKI